MGKECEKHKYCCALGLGVYFLGVKGLDEKVLVKKLKELAPEGKISCQEARQLAEQLEIDPSEVGKACNEAKIKIFACELGCF